MDFDTECAKSVPESWFWEYYRQPGNYPVSVNFLLYFRVGHDTPTTVNMLEKSSAQN